MSGYLEVKYPFRSNLGLNPFKSWKRQWCILRPSATSSGGSLAVYCSEAGASAGSVDLPAGCVVRRAKSRTRPYAFAVFSVEEPYKPRVLLATQTLHDAQIWMDKIKALLNGAKLLCTETSLKDSYSVTIVPTNLSRKCGLNGADGAVSLSPNGMLVTRSHKLGTFLDWKHVNDVILTNENADKNRMCIVAVNSQYSNGAGELKFSSPLASELVSALLRALRRTKRVRVANKLSKSEGDLRSDMCSDNEGEVRRSSYSGPSEVSLDDIDLVMFKESKRIPSGQLSRCEGAGDLAPSPGDLALSPDDLAPPPGDPSPSACALTPMDSTHPSLNSFDDSMCDRRSLASVASGIYEEIPELPPAGGEGGAGAVVGAGGATNALYCRMSPEDVPDGLFKGLSGREEPTYESVSECVYATMRRARRGPPPPLPPRLTTKPGESWKCTAGGSVTRHSSLGALPGGGAGGVGGAGGGAGEGGATCTLPRCAAPRAPDTRTLPRADKSKQPFSVFRKRLKSDSRIAGLPKCDTSKENKDVETKKKKFDFTPTRDIFKSFNVSRKMKNLKLTSALNKTETKSCEFLDETEHVTANRCSKSVECLEGNNEFLNEYEADLSIEFNDDPLAALTLPQEIVNLILRSEQLNKVRLKEDESEYMPMSPVVPPPPMEHHYIVMSPRANTA